MGRLSEAGELRNRFAIVAFLCASLMFVSGIYFVRALFLPDTGLIRYDPEVVVREGGVYFFPSAPFTAPVAAGVLPERDRILAVNAQDISGTRDLVRASLEVKSFEPYTLRVERDAAEVLTISVRSWFRPARLDWLIDLVFCLMLAVAACAISWKLPHAISTLPLVLSALLTILFTCIRPFSYESILSNVLANIGNVSSWLLVIFALYFPWRRGSPQVRGIVVVLVITLYAAFCIVRAELYARWMASGLEALLIEYRRLGQLVIVSDGIAYALLAVLLGSAYARSRLPRDKRMLQWLLAGVLIAFPPYFFLDQLPLILGGPAHQVGLGSLAQLFLSILPLFLLLALMRRTALNLRSFLAHYGIYGTLLVLTIGLFGIAYVPLRNYIAAAYRLAEPLPEIFAAGVFIVALGVLRLPIQRLFLRAQSGRTAEAGRKTGQGLQDLIEIAEESSRSLHASRLTETRSILRGIVRTLRDPVQLLAAGAAESGTTAQKEAGAEATYFLGTLQSLAGSASSMSGPAAPEAIAKAAAERVRSRFPHVEFRLDGKGLGRFLCYPEEMIQAVSLLLENAAEALKECRGLVRIHIASDRARVTIEISDDGPGVDTLARRRLFKPFVTTKPGHRGLGLYFARIIAERNDGFIDFGRSESGGATFRLAFPRITEEG